MTDPRQRLRRVVDLSGPMGRQRLAWILFVLAVASAMASGLESFATSSPATSDVPTSLIEAPQDQSIDFSKFYHNNAGHARLPCLVCHRRESGSIQPVMPGGGGHLPCTGCHAKEFTNSASPVCSICHTNAQSGALKKFPPLRSFNVRFDHATHTRGQRLNCSTCHRPVGRGQALSIPAGVNGHRTCFQCHGPQAKSGDRDISSCGTCHKPGGYSRTPVQAAAFRVGFSHAAHAGRQQSCAACHTVRAGMAQRRQVTSPLPLNHHAPAQAASCATCHNGKKAFGGDNFAVCSRCHKGTRWQF